MDVVRSYTHHTTVQTIEIQPIVQVPFVLTSPINTFHDNFFVELNQRFYAIVIFLGAISGADLGNVTAKIPFSICALISFSYDHCQRR
jgi:hypothetical protein